MRDAYREKIKLITPHHDERHVEALMRLELGTLDNIDGHDFTEWTKACALGVEEMGPDMAEHLARSMGV